MNMANPIELDERAGAFGEQDRQNNVAANGQEELVTSPFCRELRSKKYYFLQEMASEEHHLLDATNHCWCSVTMQAIGPDGERAYAGDCKPDRPCYKSLFAE